jgi:hypothetical protein
LSFPGRHFAHVVTASCWGNEVHTVWLYWRGILVACAWFYWTALHAALPSVDFVLCSFTETSLSYDYDYFMSPMNPTSKWLSLRVAKKQFLPCFSSYFFSPWISHWCFCRLNVCLSSKFIS